MKTLLVMLVATLALVACEAEQPFEISQGKQVYMAKMCHAPADNPLEELYAINDAKEFDYYFRLNDGKKVWFVYSVTCDDGNVIINPNYPETVDQFTR
jgi:hypothetical protein